MEDEQFYKDKYLNLRKKYQSAKKELSSFRKLKAENEKLKVVINTNTAITNSLNKEDILKVILEQTKKILTCEYVTILLVDKEIGKLKFAVLSKEEEKEILKDINLDKGEGIAGTVWATGTPMLIKNTKNDYRFCNKVDKKTDSDTQSILAVPLTVDGEIIGVLEAINKTKGTFSYTGDLKLLQYLSIQSAIAIKNSQLYEESNTDGLTKIANHKYFIRRLNEEFQRTKRFNNNLSYAMIDIDHFKNFNDTYGHQLGDEVLKSVAKILKEKTKASDIPCRYGGEEFAIIYTETNKKDALIAAERLRKLIEDFNIDWEGKIIHITISIGVVTFPEQRAKTYHEIIKMADTALYQAKRNGRNRVVYFSNGAENNDENNN